MSDFALAVMDDIQYMAALQNKREEITIKFQPANLEQVRRSLVLIERVSMEQGTVQGME